MSSTCVPNLRNYLDQSRLGAAWEQAGLHAHLCPIVLDYVHLRAHKRVNSVGRKGKQ